MLGESEETARLLRSPVPRTTRLINGNTPDNPIEGVALAATTARQHPTEGHELAQTTDILIQSASGHVGGAMYAIGLSDHSSVVVDHLDPPPAEPRLPEPGTLSAPIEAFAWIGEAVAAGVTFDVLKTLASTLVERGWSRRSADADAAAVTATVQQHLSACGYVDVVMTEVRRIDGAGWSLAGAADGSRFRAMADPRGEVMHVRVR